MSTNDRATGETWTNGLVSTFSELTGTKVAGDQILRELSEYRRSDLVEWASAILQASTELYGQSVQVQQSLIDQCLQGELATSASQVLLREGRNVIFHRRQLWLLIQLASIVCGENGRDVQSDELAKIVGRFSLMVSDFLHEIELAHIPIKVPEDLRLEWQVALLISSFEQMPDSNNLARAHSFWFESVSDPNVQLRLEECDVRQGLDSVFLTQAGVTLAEFFFILTTIYRHFEERARKKPIQPTVISAEDSWWGGISWDNRQRVLQLLSVPMSKFTAYLFGNPRQSWATDYSAMMRQPLIEVMPGAFVCPDIGYLRGFFVDGIYWTLDKGLDGKEWGNAFGAMFQWYVNRLISTAMARRPETQLMFFDQAKFQGGKHEAGDGLMLTDLATIIFEYKGTRLNSRQKSCVSIEETVKSIKDSVGSAKTGVGQLAKNIARIINGEAVLANGKPLDVTSKQRFIPVLVWYEEAAVILQARILLDELFGRFASDLKIPKDRLGPFLLFSTHDLEVFEQCSEFIPSDRLLLEYADYLNQNYFDARSAFQRYVIARFNGKVFPKGIVDKTVAKLIRGADEEHARRTRTPPIES